MLNEIPNILQGASKLTTSNALNNDLRSSFVVDCRYPSPSSQDNGKKKTRACDIVDALCLSVCLFALVFCADLYCVLGLMKERYWNSCVMHGLRIEELNGQYGWYTLRLRCLITF